jgi:arylsulfatase A-like enzyme
MPFHAILHHLSQATFPIFCALSNIQRAAIGWDNVSADNLGLMGYHTPNIDRIAKEGAVFTDAYAQQSCTAGRSSCILGEHPFRTGLLTIGMPGSPPSAS